MSPKTWQCLEIRAKSFEQLNDLIYNIVTLMRKLKKGTYVRSYFFSRYSNPSENDFFIKFGVVNSDEKAQSSLNKLLENHSAIKNIKPYDCEMWEVDGVPIDEIKCISCELFEKIKDRFG